MATEERALKYSDLLGELIDLQGEHLVISFSLDEMAAFSFFDAIFVRGHAANHPGLLNHDEDSIELKFSNGVTVTIDPSRFKAAALDELNGGKVLKIRMGDVEISFIKASADRIQ